MSSCLQQLIIQINGHKNSNIAKKRRNSAQRTHKTNFMCLAHEQTRKWRLKLTLVRLQTWSLKVLGEGMKILCIKDHVHFSIMILMKELERLLTPISQ